jgi:hypothetical protein
LRAQIPFSGCVVAFEEVGVDRRPVYEQRSQIRVAAFADPEQTLFAA